MVNLSIALPENMKDYVDAQVESGDFVDGADFVRDLIRRDQERRIHDLRQVVEDSRASGISDRSLEDLHDEAIAIAKARGTYHE